MHTSPAASAGYCAPPDRWVRLVNVDATGQRVKSSGLSATYMQYIHSQTYVHM